MAWNQWPHLLDFWIAAHIVQHSLNRKPHKPPTRTPRSPRSQPLQKATLALDPLQSRGRRLPWARLRPRRLSRPIYPRWRGAAHESRCKNSRVSVQDAIDDGAIARQRINHGIAQSRSRCATEYCLSDSHPPASNTDIILQKLSQILAATIPLGRRSSSSAWRAWNIPISK